MDNFGRLFFDPSSNRGSMLFLGNNNLIFSGQRAMMKMEDNLNLNMNKKRPIFSSPHELYYDEEYYYDEQLPEKKRRLTQDQVILLEKSFEEENKLEPERKSELAKKLGLQPRQVAVWFQNRRARSKTKQLERDYDVLKASYDSLLSNYDSIIKENAILKTEVNSLTEKLQAKEGNYVEGPKTDQIQELQVDGSAIPSQPQLNKAEDRLSSGSGGSAILNEDNPQMVDSGNSYLGCPLLPYMAAVQSEEDNISDDGRSCFPNIFTTNVGIDNEHHQGHQEEEEEELGWWVWS